MRLNRCKSMKRLPHFQQQYLPPLLVQDNMVLRPATLQEYHESQMRLREIQRLLQNRFNELDLRQQFGTQRNQSSLRQRNQAILPINSRINSRVVDLSRIHAYTPVAQQTQVLQDDVQQNIQNMSQIQIQRENQQHIRTDKIVWDQSNNKKKQLKSKKTKKNTKKQLNKNKNKNTTKNLLVPRNSRPRPHSQQNKRLSVLQSNSQQQNQFRNGLNKKPKNADNFFSSKGSRNNIVKYKEDYLWKSFLRRKYLL